MYYYVPMNQDQTYPAHWQCDTAQTIVFKWKTGCHNVFSLFSLNIIFPVKILKIFVAKSPKNDAFVVKSQIYDIFATICRET